MNAGHPSVLARVTNVNLSEPVLTGNTCQGNLTYTRHHPQISFSQLTLPWKTGPAGLTRKCPTCWPITPHPTLRLLMPYTPALA